MNTSHTYVKFSNERINRIIGKEDSKLYENSILNANQIIYEVFKNMDPSEIGKFPTKRTNFRDINRIRDNAIRDNKYDLIYNVSDELKLTISSYKYVQYDSGVLDKNRIIFLANSEKPCFLKNSDIFDYLMEHLKLIH